MAEKNISIVPAPHKVPSLDVNQQDNETKPKRRSAAKIKASPPAPASGLTGDEARLVAVYRILNDQLRSDVLGLSEWIARNPAVHRKAPALRLV